VQKKIIDSSKYEIFHRQSQSLTTVPDKKNFTYRLIFDFIDRYIFNQKLNILDAGCGVGSVSFYLANKNHQVTGIDVSKTAINAAKNTRQKLKIQNATFISGDISQKQLKKKYDLIIISEVLEHIDDDKLLLAHLSQSLKRKASMLITTPSLNAPLYKLGLLTEFDRRVGHIRRYSKTSLTKLITQSGLKVEAIEQREGLLRNYLFTIFKWGLPMRAIQKISLLGNFVTAIDNTLLKLFGGSNYFVLAKKL